MRISRKASHDEIRKIIFNVRKNGFVVTVHAECLIQIIKKPTYIHVYNYTEEFG